jgi:hypothetical protein
MTTTLLIELSLLGLMFVLLLVLTIYNHRQAAALQRTADLVGDFVALQISERRERRIQDSASLDPLAWLSRQVNSGLHEPLQLSEIQRILPGGTLEIKTRSGRLIVSPYSKADLLRQDRHQRAATKGLNANERLNAMAAKPIFKSKYGIRSVQAALHAANDLFDLEAAVVGLKLGADWGSPKRLWFHVVD